MPIADDADRRGTGSGRHQRATKDNEHKVMVAPVVDLSSNVPEPLSGFGLLTQHEYAMAEGCPPMELV